MRVSAGRQAARQGCKGARCEKVVGVSREGKKKASKARRVKETGKEGYSSERKEAKEEGYTCYKRGKAATWGKASKAIKSSAAHMLKPCRRKQGQEEKAAAGEGHSCPSSSCPHS